MKTIPALVAASAEQFGDRLAIVDGAVRLTYAELLEESQRFGAALIASGVDPGDRVGIWAFNCAEWVVALFGIVQAGAVLVPVNTRFKGGEAADILARTRVKVLVTVTDFLGTDYVAMLRACGAELPDLRTVVIARGEAPADTDPWAAFCQRASSSARLELAGRAAAVGTDDVSDILFTSGTTGIPKGVMQTHGRTLLVASDWVDMTGLTRDDRYLMVNPYFHMFGLKAGILASVTAGATMFPEPVFDVEHVLATVAAEQITVLPGAPTIYQAILDCADRHLYDLTSLRVAVTGAADIPVALIGRIVDELPFPSIVTGYGLTEAGTAAATGPEDDLETVATTVGRPRPGFEIRIIDAAGADVGPGEPGEITVRGGSVMVGYLDDPEGTALTLSEEGWLKTGDLGVMDPAGCLRIVGRSKDMFIVGGFNAYPAEIENALLRHPAVAQVAVIGVPDPRLGEVGVAFVVLRLGSTVTATELIEWSRDQMANYKVPRSIELVGDLPRNATGKVIKDALRTRAVGA